MNLLLKRLDFSQRVKERLNFVGFKEYVLENCTNSLSLYEIAQIILAKYPMQVKLILHKNKNK